MTKKDIAEIRKRYRIDRHSFTRIAGCYVNSEKEIVASFSESPISMEEDDLFKYIEIAKKSLSGRVGDKILELQFNDDAGKNVSESLLKIVESGLKDDDTVKPLFDMIISSYDCPGNYLIIVFHDNYDVPSKAEDGINLDESDTVFSYMLVAICPVNLSKPGLGYIDDEERIGSLLQEWTAAPVDTAFMYPAFSDRAADLYHTAFYSRKPDQAHHELMETMGLVTRLSETEKRGGFTDLVKDAADKDNIDEQMFNVADGLSAYIDKNRELNGKDSEVLITPNDIGDILTDAGFDEETADGLKEKYMGTFPDQSDQPLATDLIDHKLLKNQRLYHEKQALQREVARLNKRTDDNGAVMIQIPDALKDTVKKEIIDGQEYIIIPAEAVSVG